MSRGDRQDTFIEELTEQIFEAHKDDLDRVVVIFPNRRAGLFFQKSLGKLIDRPVWMPTVLSMEDFVLSQSSLKKIESLEAIFILYEAYKQLQPNAETFDQFFFWGEMILRDFEEIDHYLVEPEHLFRSIKTQKELDEEFYFLDEEDKRIIQTFWASFLPKASKGQEAFLETWRVLLPLYDAFKEELKARGKGYAGMIYREVVDNLSKNGHSTDGIYYFAGFNALTYTEEKILKHYVESHDAKAVWDLDSYYVKNTKQEAGHFFRIYSQDSTLGKTFKEKVPARFNTQKKLKATGVSLEIGQTKALAEELTLLAERPDFDPQRTVVVLPQEYMLFPVLHAIPDQIDKVNVTMGFPLKDTPVFSLLESLLVLQQMRRESVVHGTSFYHRPLIELLEHPLVFVLEEEAIATFVSKIRKQNRILVYEDEIELHHPLLQLVFRKTNDPLKYLLDVLKALYEAWTDKGHQLELEYISRFYEHIAQLEEMIGDKVDQLGFEFLIRLFRKLSRSLKVPFTGEPLDGLQIMGILETRNLDFEHVFILNMNEDSWPGPARRGSFIPYNIRRAFDLPVFDHQDSIYAYLFYRLIQRASNVHFFYNIVSEFNVNGELSRLVRQLETESDFSIEKRILANPIGLTPPKNIDIVKTEEVLKKMERYLAGYKANNGVYPSAYTPSALNTYLDCRLKFYFKYVEQLYEPDEVHEEMDPMLFGNILHDGMEILYRQFIAKEKRDIIYAEDIFWVKAGVEGAINKAFVKHYGIKNEKKFVLEGKALIGADVIKKFMLKILDYDQSYAPFRILGLEASQRDGYSIEFPVNVKDGTKTIRLKGIIDRIDLKEEVARVIDYKTGRDDKDFTDVPSLFDRLEKNRRKAVFQVFYYSLLFDKQYQGSYHRIEPGIFNSRDLFQVDYEWQVYHKSAKQRVNDFADYKEAFEEHLAELIAEMYDSNTSFNQTEDLKKCEYCPYKDICGR